MGQPVFQMITEELMTACSSSSSHFVHAQYYKHEPRELIKLLKYRPLKLRLNEYLKAFTSYYEVTFYFLNDVPYD